VTAELALAVVSLVVSVACLITLLTLLVRKRLDYPTLAEHDELEAHVTDELARMQRSLSQLYRYVEAVDDHTGARGYRVLGRPVPADNATSGK
jgi:hypothetical protein